MVYEIKLIRMFMKFIGDVDEKNNNDIINNI